MRNRALVGGLLLALTALVVPLLAAALHLSVTGMPSGQAAGVSGRLPGTFLLLAAGVAVLLAAALRPALLAAYLDGDRASPRSTVLSALQWSVSGTVLWMALLFFVGGLDTMDRSFPVTLAALMGLALAALGLGIIDRLVVAVTLPGFLVSAALVAWSQGVFSSPADVAGSAGPAWTWTGRLLRPPSIFVASYAAAFAAAYLTLPVLVGRVARPGCPVAGLVKIAAWIILAHLAWLVLLFVAGHADLPRWLPLATALLAGATTAGALGLFMFAKGTRLSGDDLYAPFIDPSLLAAASARAEVETAAARPGRRAWVISGSGASREARVMRVAEALSGAGWNVVMFAADGRSPHPGEWAFIRLPQSSPYTASGQRVALLVRQLALLLLIYGRPRNAFKWAARIAHSANLVQRHTGFALAAVASERADLKADLVIADGYQVADAASKVAHVYRAKLSVDVEAYARDQFANDAQWVRWEKPVVTAVQDTYLRRADHVTAACQGIADLLEKETPLKARPIVIRNLPLPSLQRFRPVGERIKVLYHGDLSRPRQIHVAIRSMPMWRTNIDLVLRGGGDPAYIGDLKRLVQRLGLAGRVSFEPAVPPEQVVAAAHAADIGFFSYEAHSPQIRFALPGKLFEYIMAGLAVCTGDLAEVGRIVRAHEVGKLIPQHTPESIAETLNSFTRQEIDACKQAAIAASRQLNWEAERGRLVASYEAMF